MTDEIKIIFDVRPEQFDKFFGIDEWLYFYDMSNKEIYDKMLLVVVNENGEPLSIEVARKLFKKIPKTEWLQHVNNFVKIANDTFVSPTTGGG